mgnify:CR=1 FL=1
MEDVLIVGGGPAGLMAADYLSKLNLKITIVDQMPTMGRKFLMAGKSGLNLTKFRPNLIRLACPNIGGCYFSEDKAAWAGKSRILCTIHLWLVLLA